MCEKWQIAQDDPRITEMEPIQKIWMFQNWMADQNDKMELAKNHAYLIGSFYNPEAVQQLMDGPTHESTDDELEDSINMVNNKLSFNDLISNYNERMTEPTTIRKRKRRSLKE